MNTARNAASRWGGDWPRPLGRALRFIAAVLVQGDSWLLEVIDK